MTPSEVTHFLSTLTLRLISTIFGSSGVFCLYAFAVSQREKYAVSAMACLLVAMAVTIFTPSGPSK